MQQYIAFCSSLSNKNFPRLPALSPKRLCPNVILMALAEESRIDNHDVRGCNTISEGREEGQGEIRSEGK